MTEATETAKELRRLQDKLDKYSVENGSKAMQGYIEAVLEQGTMYPDAKVTHEVDLSLKDRVKGTYEHPVQFWLGVGLILGAGLERDIPADSELDEKFRNGEIELPEND